MFLQSAVALIGSFTDLGWTISHLGLTWDICVKKALLHVSSSKRIVQVHSNGKSRGGKESMEAHKVS